MPVTIFFWEPLSDNILQERDELGALTAEYTTEPRLYGNVVSQNRGGVESRLHFDAIGSTLALTDGSQQVTDEWAYTAFGETTESSGSATFPFQYVGKLGYYRGHLTAQYMVRRRAYAPVRARWLSADDFLDERAAVYLYVDSRPTIAWDPSGQDVIPTVSEPPLSETHQVPSPGRRILPGAEWNWILAAPRMPLVVQNVRVEVMLECHKTCGCPPNALRAYYEWYEIWNVGRATKVSEVTDKHRTGVYNPWIYLNDKCRPKCNPCLPWSFSAKATFEVANMPIPPGGGGRRPFPNRAGVWFVRTPVKAVATVDCYSPPAECTKSQSLVTDFHSMYPTEGEQWDDRGLLDREWISGRHRILTCTDTWAAQFDEAKCPAFTLKYNSSDYK